MHSGTDKGTSLLDCKYIYAFRSLVYVWYATTTLFVHIKMNGTPSRRKITGLDGVAAAAFVTTLRPAFALPYIYGRISSGSLARAIEIQHPPDRHCHTNMNTPDHCGKHKRARFLVLSPYPSS